MQRGVYCLQLLWFYWCVDFFVSLIFAGFILGKAKKLLVFCVSINLFGLNRNFFTTLAGETVHIKSPEAILTRLEFWRLSIEQFFNSPFFGLGFRLHELLGNLEIEKGIYYPHNYLFESLVPGGIIMSLPLLYCILFPVINFHKYIKLEASVLPIYFLGSQVLIYSMHNGHLGDFPLFWMIIGMMAGTKIALKGKSTRNLIV